jgi:predicted Rossmann fold nucleotide-binding protein DprA/Smf involved in DNA uptake
MSDAGLVELARRYVRLSDELDAVRGEIARAVLNGAGETQNVPFVHAQRRGESASLHPNAQAAAKAEARILELLKARPMRTGEIATATEAKINTVTERLKRMKAKGLVERDTASAGWAASA